MRIGDKVKHKFSEKCGVVVDVLNGCNKLITIKFENYDFEINLPESDLVLIED